MNNSFNNSCQLREILFIALTVGKCKVGSAWKKGRNDEVVEWKCSQTAWFQITLLSFSIQNQKKQAPQLPAGMGEVLRQAFRVTNVDKMLLKPIFCPKFLGYFACLRRNLRAEGFLVTIFGSIKWHLRIRTVESQFYFRILLALTHLQCWWIYGKLKLCFSPAVSPMWQ